MASVLVVAVSFSKELASFQDGSFSKLQNYIDRFGDDTDDIFDAVSALAPLTDGGFAIVELDNFVFVSRH